MRRAKGSLPFYGAENVYDFSLGNPNVPAPEAVKEAALHVLNEEDSLMVHGYMSNSGYEDVRKAVADSLNNRFGTHYDESNLVMTVGAAGGNECNLQDAAESRGMKSWPLLHISESIAPM